MVLCCDTVPCLYLTLQQPRRPQTAAILILWCAYAVVLLQIYDDMLTPKVNQMVEFLGIYELDPSAGVADYSDDTGLFDMEAEMRAHHPPSSLIARVHCLATRPLTHNNPLVPAPQAQAGILAVAREARQQLKGMIMQCSGMTEIVAEYVILHLMSRVHTRKDELVLGKMSLNLLGLGTETSAAAISGLLELLEGLLTKMHVMDMSIDTLNTARLVPEKDIASNRLQAGRLQLADGTAFVLDETVLGEGQLKDWGVRNLKALGHLVQDQQVEYNFKFSSIKFDADIPVLVFSEGKSLLPADFLVACELTAAPAAITVSNEALNAVRAYLTVCREMEHTLDDACKEVRFAPWRHVLNHVLGPTRHAYDI